MNVHVDRKRRSLSQLRDERAALREAGKTVVLCHGCFDIVHPGHVRHLRYAGQQGDVLVVSLTGDSAIEKGDGSRPYVPQELRAENLAALEFVDCVVIVDHETAEPVIEALEPDLYVKGREYEHSTHPGFLAEKACVEGLGGRVMFTSGDVVFSSTSILENAESTLRAEGVDDAARLASLCARWKVDHGTLGELVRERFSKIGVVVVGDCIAERYQLCDAMGGRELGPAMTIRPHREASYLGGAAAAAAHLRGLGARVRLVTSLGEDRASQELAASLERLGVQVTAVGGRHALAVMQRFYVDEQKVLNVDQGQPRPLDSALQEQVRGLVAQAVGSGSTDALLVFDSGYGMLSSALLGSLLDSMRKHVRVLAGGVSGARRTLLSMRGMDLLSVAEDDLRRVLGEADQSLPTIAASLMDAARTPNLLVSMGRRGGVMFRPRTADPSRWFESRLRSEFMPALDGQPRDASGVSEAVLSMLTAAWAAGAEPMQAVYLAHAGAAIVGQSIGQAPLQAETLLAWLARRPELALKVGAGEGPRFASVA